MHQMELTDEQQQTINDFAADVYWRGDSPLSSTMTDDACVAVAESQLPVLMMIFGGMVDRATARQYLIDAMQTIRKPHPLEALES